MSDLTQALRGAQHLPPAAAGGRAQAVVVGAGGALGSALLEQMLASGGFAQVTAVIKAPLASALRRFDTVTLERLHRVRAETAFIVFERARHANGRDEAFVRPQVEDLAALAAQLHRAGVRRLLVIVPHAPALLPGALRRGLATLDETAVAALGFEHLIFVRAAALGGAPSGPRGGLERFAAWWWSQLRWMIPAQEQPLRVARLAALVVQVASRLDAAAPGTRVLAPEQLAQAARPDAAERVLDAWLRGAEAAPAQRR